MAVWYVWMVADVSMGRVTVCFLCSVQLLRHTWSSCVEAVRADVVRLVHVTGSGFNGGCRVGEEVVSAVIAALAGRFLILLNSHFLNTPRGLKVNF